MAHSTRGGLTRQERMFQQKSQYRNRIGDDTYQPESLLDGMAHLEMLELKKGTRLAPLRYAGDFDRVLDRYPDMGKFVDYNPQQAGIRLLSSNAPRAWAAAHQQHAFGIKGMSTLGMIENFKRRLADGIPMDDIGIPAEKRAAFAQQLTVLENQVRNAAYDMRPVDVDLSSNGDRNLSSMARGSVAVMSGGNFALSALAEVFATIPRTLANMIQGDFAAIGDYFAGLSPRARQEALANVNGWETAKMEMGMRSRMGDMGIDSLEEMLDRDSAPTLTDRLEDGSRKMQKFSMAGMRTFTEYSRTVATRQSMRKNIRMAGRGAFGKFAVEVKGLGPNPTLKEIRGAARKAGMDPMLAVSLHQNGVLDAGMLRQLQEVFGDNNYFDVNGLKVSNFNRAFGGDERLRAVVTHVLQFENNKVNLDTRIGNKQMPKNVVEQLIGALGQYPMLFYSRMRQGAWQGGALLGTAAIMLPLALGEIYYHVLTETAREGNTEPIEKWGRDPLGAMASVISKMNISGGFTPLQSWGSATLVQSIRQATENPAFMEGFNTQTFGMSPINAAGLGMFVSGIRKFSSASADIMNGDYQEGIKKAKDLGPFSYKQIWKGMFNMMLQDEKLGKAMMRGSQGSPVRAPRGLSRPQGVAATPQPVQAPQTPQTQPERPSAPQPKPTPKPSLGDSLDGQQVSAEDLGSALDGDKT